jgi:hypothetical protein
MSTVSRPHEAAKQSERIGTAAFPPRAAHAAVSGLREASHGHQPRPIASDDRHRDGDMIVSLMRITRGTVPLGPCSAM